jgi:uncharacterized protein (DUF302 family)
MYSFATLLTGKLEEIAQNLIATLKDEGFSILAEIDVQAPLKEKPDIGNRVYRILGAYDPTFVNQATDAKTDIGFLLPCNVMMREEQGGAIRVTFMVPNSILNLLGRKDISKLRNEAFSGLLRVHQRLGGTMIDPSHIKPLDLCATQRF